MLTIESITNNPVQFDALTGLDQEDFNLYQCLDQQVEGHGIGLYLVNEIMVNAGGKVETKSKYGKGTTFTLFFKQ